MRALAPYPHKEKHEILDWSRLPRGACEMNFRPPSAHPTGNIRGFVAWLCAIATAGGLTGIALRYLIGPFLASPIALGLAVVIGIILAIANGVGGYWPWGIRVSRIPRKWTAAALFCVPLIAWFLTISLSRADAFVGPVAVLMLTAVPALFVSADMMTTHAVYWMTANPRVSGKTLKRWRTSWGQRFQGVLPKSMGGECPTRKPNRSRAAIKMHNRYLTGFLLVAAAISVPAVIARILFGLGVDHPLGAMIVIGQLSALLFVSALRTSRVGLAVRVYGRMLEHCLTYGRGRVYPPWVFQSPAGSCETRRVAFAGVLLLLAITIVPLLVGEVALPLPSHQSGSAFACLTANWSAFWQQQFIPVAQSVSDGSFTLVARIATLPLVAVLVSTLYFLLATYILSSTALLEHYDMFEKPNAPAQHKKWSLMDGYSHRLSKSKNKTEKNSIILGSHQTLEYPILLDTDLLREHMHILGATGGSKTALGLSTLVTQLIRRSDGPVIVVDCKGDPAFFNTVRIEAKQARRTFKWFTNRLGRSTYVFNPFDQKHLERLALPEYTGLFMASLNLHHGEDYARAWFSAASRRLFQRALDQLVAQGRSPHSPIESFRELERTIQQFAKDDYEYRAALHLVFIVQSLSQFRQLNLSSRDNSDEHALEHAIHMPDVIRQKQVVYFSLVGATDVASVAQIAKLVVYSALSAAIAHRDLYGERPKIYLVCDEAQTIIAQNIQNVLAQAREHGLACVLAHQTMSQLNPPGGVDLRELVANCTCIKQVFTARDPSSRKFVSDISGQVGYYSPSWKQSVLDVVSGDVQLANAVDSYGGAPLVDIHQEVGPRLMDEDIADVNRDPNSSMVAIERIEGYSSFIGAFPIFTDWPVSKAEYEKRLLRTPWPPKTDETIKETTAWPEPNNETIVATHHPPLSGPEDSPTVSDKLREIKRKLGDK
jgi:hypothetical protein